MNSLIPAQVLASKLAHVGGLSDFFHSYSQARSISPMIDALNKAATPRQIGSAVDALVVELQTIVDTTFSGHARARATALIDGLTIIKQRSDVPDLVDTVARMKDEILADIDLGRLPPNVASFAELHDFVDANEYGGFCDDALMATMLAHFGGADEHGAWPDDMMNFTNAAQFEVDRWLEAGRP